MRWFGDTWDATVNRETAQAATPAGVSCAYSGCGRPIMAEDSGFLIPYVSVEADPDTAERLVVVPGEPWPHLPYHRRCMVEMVLGPDAAARAEP